MYKMMIVEDEPLARFGIKNTVNWAQYGIKIVAEAANGREGFEMAKLHHPDIIITDVKMPFVNGLEMIKMIRDANITTEFVILSGYGEFEFARVAIENQVVNYLLKPVSNEELVDTVLKVIEKLKSQEVVKKSNYILENSKEEIKRKVIRILVRKYYESIDDLKNQLTMYDSKLIDRGFFVVAVLDEKFELQEATEILFVFESILSEILDGEGIRYICGIYHEKASFLIEASSQSQVEKLVNQALLRYQMVNTQTISSGISTYFEGVDEIHRVYEEAKSVANNGLLKFINSVQRFNGESEIYSPNVLRALNVIHQEYMNDINVSYVSEKLNVSDSYLMHMFKDQLGITFNKILIDTRIREAKMLLKTGEYRVKEVAYKVGFNDEKYFTMIFKKQTGLTPSEFSKKPWSKNLKLV